MKCWSLGNVCLPEALVGLLNNATYLLGRDLPICLVLDSEATDLMADEQEIILALSHASPCNMQLGVEGGLKYRVLLPLKKLHL